MQAGGALAVYRHLREFTPHVKLIGLTGTEPWLDATLGSFIRAEGAGIVRSPDFHDGHQAALRRSPGSKARSSPSFFR